MLETCTLYPYQDLKYRQLLGHIQAGEQDLLACMPPSSGKTKMIQYLLGDLQAGERFSTILVVVPLLAIKAAWHRPIQISTAYGEPIHFRSYGVPSHELQSKEFWQRRVSRIYVTSRAAVSTTEVRDLLRTSRPDCRRVLVICDEGHHHVEGVTQAGDFCRLVQSLGGVTIRVTGTPWHAQAAVRTEKTQMVRLSAAEYARQKDPKTDKPLAPQRWESRRVLVKIKTDDLSLALERGRKNEKLHFSDEHRAETIKALVAKWVEDGCPKLIINVPQIEGWVKPLILGLARSIKARRLLGRAPHIHDFTGSQNVEGRKAMIDLLDREHNARTWDQSSVDVIVSCARMDEGTDWVFCSHVYNVRMPNSPRQILQRWARAGRNKRGISGYPEKWADVQPMTFFMPILSEEAKDQMWKEHRDVALIMACFLEDYETAQKWVNDSPELDKFSKLYNRRAPCSELESSLSLAMGESTFNEALEGDDFSRAEAWAELIKLTAARPDMIMGELWALVKEKLKNANSETRSSLLSALLSHLKEANHELYGHLRKALQRLRQWKNRSMIREGMQVIFDQIAAEFEHLVVPAPKHMLEQVAMFTAYDAAHVAQKLACRWWGFPWTKELIFTKAQKFHHEFHRLPSKNSGPWTDFQGPSWSGANMWLQNNHGITLSQLLQGSGRREYEPWSIDLIVAEAKNFQLQHGRWPSCKTKDKCEAFQGRRWATAWKWAEKQGFSRSELLKIALRTGGIGTDQRRLGWERSRRSSSLCSSSVAGRWSPRTSSATHHAVLRATWSTCGFGWVGAQRRSWIEKLVIDPRSQMAEPLLRRIVAIHLSQKPHALLAQGQRDLGYMYPVVQDFNLVVEDKLFRIILAPERPYQFRRSRSHEEITFVDFQVDQMEREGHWRDLMGFSREGPWKPLFTGRLTKQGLTIESGAQNTSPLLLKGAREKILSVLQANGVTRLG